MNARQLCGRTAVIGLTVLVLVVLALSAWFGRSVLLLVFAGVLLAVLLRAITDFLKRRLHLHDTVALSLTVLLLLGAAGLLAFLVAPHVEQQALMLWQQLPDTVAKARQQLQERTWGQHLLQQLPSFENLFSHGQVLAKSSVATVSGALGVIGNLVVIGFVGLYLAVSPERYSRGAVKLLPPHLRPVVWETLGAAGDSLRRWLMGKLALMLFVGVSTAIGLSLLHVPLVFPLALLAALLDFIPNIGPVASAVPAVLLALTISPAAALWVALLYLGVQVVESYILSPLVQGNAVSLPPAILISAQVLFGVLLGLPGVLLATPLTVVLLVFLRRLWVGALVEGGGEKS